MWMWMYVNRVAGLLVIVADQHIGRGRSDVVAANEKVQQGAHGVTHTQERLPRRDETRLRGR